MRIISKKSDYYDGIQKYGYDPTQLYIRKSEKIDGEYFSSDLFLEDIYGIIFKYYIIGFCGELYPLIHIHKLKGGEHYYCYSIKEVDKCIKKFKELKDLQEIYFKNKLSKARIYHRENLRKRIEKRFTKEYLENPTYDKWFMQEKKKKKKKNSETLNKIFFDKNIPVFIIKNNGNKNQMLKTNPILKDYGFQKIKDPWTAYQEISQFVSGVLIDVKRDSINISDTDMRDKKGFDEWSFKTMPSKRKK